MKILIAFALFWLGASKLYSQKRVVPDSLSCSRVIADFSYFWKLDSLANNGFRLVSIPLFTHTIIDKVTPSFLMEKLGKPYEVWKTRTQVQYVYFIFDQNNVLEKYKVGFESQWLSFNFDTKETYLISIDNGPFN